MVVELAFTDITSWRGPDGAWINNDVSKLAYPAAFVQDPVRVWQFYHHTWETVLRAEPNAAHLALAMLRVKPLRALLAPDARFVLVTQNIDGLDARAAKTVCEQAEAGLAPDAPLYEMHGRVLDTLCTGCGAQEHNDASPLISAFSGVQGESKLRVEDLPHCTKCSALLRPGVVWFEEKPHSLLDIWAAVDEADLCIVVGTGSTVYPAAAFAHEVSSNKGKVAIFNLARTEGDETADFLFLGPCESTLPEVLFKAPPPQI